MKEFKDWSFDDLCSQMCWEFIQGISQGTALKAIIWKICNVTTSWSAEQAKKQKTARKRA